MKYHVEKLIFKWLLLILDKKLLLLIRQLENWALNRSKIYFLEFEKQPPTYFLKIYVGMYPIFFDAKRH